MKVLLAGGGSGGPVSPVLAVAMELKKLHPKTDLLFVGTKRGPERKMVEPLGIKFKSITATKLRRYFSIWNLFIPFALTAGILQSLKIVRTYKPDVVFSAGGFVAVPICWAARYYKVRIVIHQQDAQIGLANKLIAPFAGTITTAFQQTSKEFYSGSGIFNKTWHAATWVGNPVRNDLFNSIVDAKKYFHLHDDLPVLLILGGATGSSQINHMVEKVLPSLVATNQVIHQTGQGKNKIQYRHINYHPYELIPYAEYAAILKLAHLVVARAGLSTIAELSALGKAAIIIPMPHTHQEENGKILELTHSAVVFSGADANAENLGKIIQSLKFNVARVATLEKNMVALMPKDAALKIAKIIIQNELPA